MWEKSPASGRLTFTDDVVATALGRGGMVVLESTAYPGTTEDRVAPRLEAATGLRALEDDHLVFSPERIDPGSPIYYLENTPRVVGGLGEAAGAAASSCWRADLLRARARRRLLSSAAGGDDQQVAVGPCPSGALHDPAAVRRDGGPPSRHRSLLLDEPLEPRHAFVHGVLERELAVSVGAVGGLQQGRHPVDPDPRCLPQPTGAHADSGDHADQGRPRFIETVFVGT